MQVRREAGRPGRGPGWWHTLGALGLALVLPGGLLVLLLYLMTRSRARPQPTARDPYVLWLQRRDQVRNGHPVVPGLPGATSTRLTTVG